MFHHDAHEGLRTLTSLASAAKKSGWGDGAIHCSVCYYIFLDGELLIGEGNGDIYSFDGT